MSRKQLKRELHAQMAVDAITKEIAEDMLNHLPSVIPQPKTGQWETSGDYFTGAYESIDYVRCSCCGYDSLEEGNYCPNCGADMRGGLGMTGEEALKMMQARLECIERNISGNYKLCNNKCDECKLCYEKGTLGEQKEWLQMAIKALEQKTCDGCIYENSSDFEENCRYCNRFGTDRYQSREEMEEE